MLAEFADVARGLAFSPPRIAVVCSVTGEPDPELIATAAYWVRQAREPVRFADCARWLADAGTTIFAELGPDGALCALGPAALGPAAPGPAADNGDIPVWVPVLRTGRPEQAAVLSAAAEAFVRGIGVNWPAVFAGSGARRADLPTYAFQRQRYWPNPRPAHTSGIPVAGGDGAEAGFWAAVDRQDVAGLAGALRMRGDEPFSAVLPVLAAWRRRRHAQSAMAGWRYQVRWQPVTGLADGAVLAGRWLLVVPAASAGGKLAAACEQVLADGGADVVTVEVAVADLDRETLAGRLREADGQKVAGVVSLLALDETGHAGVAGTLVLVQALGDAGMAARLWAVTRGAVSAGADAGPACVVQAQVWGLGQVAALEHPRRWGGLVDVPEVLSGRPAGWLRAVLAGDSGEDQVAIRPGGVLARRLVRTPGATGNPPWRPSGPVLITGGTGALGGQVARWLAGRSAPRVVLVSRQGMAAVGAARLAATLCAVGSAVTVTACDVADRIGLAALLTRLNRAGVTVSAVLHTAGVLDDGVVDALTPDRLATVLAPKVTAALHLDELTADLDLDAFVLFSSIAGTVGAAGQANYAAANACLDAIAEHRRARGLVATSVAWGVWGGGGMAVQAVTARARRGGVLAMPPRLAAAALGLVIAEEQPTAVVADIDWARFTPGFTASRPSPLLTGVKEALAVIEAGGARPARQRPLAERLAALPVAGQEELVLDLVCQEAAAVLGHASANKIRPGVAFRDVGFDSLTAVEFRNRMAVATGQELPATLVFDYPTPHVLARWLRTVISPLTEENADASAEEAEIRRALASIPLARLRGAGLTEPLLRLAAFQSEQAPPDEEGETNAIDAMDMQSLIRMAHGR
jgi:NADP-dependent 3-hydroxy acid dehydrogenase YdfG